MVLFSRVFVPWLCSASAYICAQIKKYPQMTQMNADKKATGGSEIHDFFRKIRVIL